MINEIHGAVSVNVEPLVSSLGIGRRIGGENAGIDGGLALIGNIGLLELQADDVILVYQLHVIHLDIRLADGGLIERELGEDFHGLGVFRGGKGHRLGRRSRRIGHRLARRIGHVLGGFVTLGDIVVGVKVGKISARPHLIGNPVIFDRDISVGFVSETEILSVFRGDPSGRFRVVCVIGQKELELIRLVGFRKLIEPEIECLSLSRHRVDCHRIGNRGLVEIYLTFAVKHPFFIRIVVELGAVIGGALVVVPSVTGGDRFGG